MKTKRENILLYALLVVYIALNAFLAAYHEPWRDEAQSWLIVRDLNFPQIIDLMNSEGHGCLWYAILYPFIKGGISIYVQNVIAVMINGFAAWLLLFRSPFPIYLRIPVVFGTTLMYYFPVIARNYALVPVLLFLIAWIYRDRNEKPWLYCLFLAMLVQTHVYILMAGFSLSLFFLVERIRLKRNGPIRDALPLILPLLSGILLVIELTPLTSSVDSPGVSEESRMLFRSFVSSVRRMMPGSFRSLYILSLITGALLLIVLIFTAVRVRQARIPVLALFLIWAYQVWMNASVYNMSTQRALLTVVSLVAVVWMSTAAAVSPGNEDSQPDENDVNKRTLRILHISLALWLSVTGVRAVAAYVSEVREPYSNGVLAAAFINSEISAEALIMTDDEPIAQAVIPFLTGRDHLSCMGEEFSYVVYSEPHSEDSGAPDWLGNVEKAAGSYDGQVYYVACKAKASDRLSEAGYELIYEDVMPAITDDDYRIYRLR